MSACVDIEIRPQSGLTPLERAKARDSFVREFERQWNDWVAIARCCMEFDRDKDWALLGYRSFGEWICEAAPKSRSYLYLVMGRYRELIPDIPEEELAQIPLGSAGVLKQLSPSVRRQSKIRQLAKQRPEKFVADLQVMEPMQHVEARVRKEVMFTASQWAVIEPKFEAFVLTDEHATLADFIEFLCSEAYEA